MLAFILAVPLVIQEIEGWVVAITAILALFGIVHQLFVKPLLKNITNQIINTVQEKIDEVGKKVDEHLTMERASRSVIDMYLREVHARLKMLEDRNGLTYPFPMGGTPPSQWYAEGSSERPPWDRTTP